MARGCEGGYTQNARGVWLRVSEQDVRSLGLCLWRLDMGLTSVACATQSPVTAGNRDPAKRKIR